MAADDQSGSGARPAGPVVLRIKLRYDSVDAMVQRFASNVGKSGLFLPTKSLQPVGTEVKFELRIATDVPVLVGLGRVKHVRPYDAARPKAAFGMAIELTRVSREGRELIIKMIERRRALGLPDVAIPVPDDGDQRGRGESDSQPRADTSGVVREAMREFASAPVAEQVLSAPAPGPLAVAKPASAPTPLPALAPERPRARRPAPTDLMTTANELAARLASVDVPGLEGSIDVERALARARMLAGSHVDGELAALRESAAAPYEISVEAASAELARQLGGTAIARRERSSKHHAPLSVPIVRTIVEPQPQPQPQVQKPVAPEPVGSHPVAAEVHDAVAEYASDDKTRVPTGDVIDHAPPRRAPDPDDSLAIPIEPAGATTEAMLRRALEGSSPAVPLDDSDLEAVDDAEDEDRGESTQIGTFAPAPDELADRLDQELAEAEAEADHEFRDMAAASPADAGEEVADNDVLAEADASDADLLHADAERDASYEDQATSHEAPSYDEQASAYPEPAADDDIGYGSAFGDPLRPSQVDFASRLDLGDDEDEEERRNFPTANPRPRRAARADSNTASTRRESHPALASGDDFDEPHGFTQNTPVPVSPRSRSSSRAPEAFEQPVRSPAPEQEPSDPVGRALAMLEEPSRPRAEAPLLPPAEELDDALAALDGDLEQSRRPLPGMPAHRGDTGETRPAPPVTPSAAPAGRSRANATGKSPTMPPPIPAAARRSQPTGAHRVAPPVRQAPRAATDDGILIDFDDDE